jgi:hypothetical protein
VAGHLRGQRDIFIEWSRIEQQILPIAIFSKSAKKEAFGKNSIQVVVVKEE